MKTKQLIYMLIALITVSAIIFFVNKSNKTNPELNSYLFPQLDTKQVSSLEIQKDTITAKLERKNKYWVIKNNINYRADSTNIANALESIKNLKKKSIVSKNKNKWDRFSVTDTSKDAVKVIGKDKNGKELFGFILGKSGFNIANTEYLRFIKGSEVYQTTKTIKSKFFYTPRRWRDQRVWTFDPKDIISIDVNYSNKKDSSFIVVKNANEWKFQSKKDVKIDTTKIKRYVKTLLDIRTSNWTNNKNKNIKKSFKKPSIVVSLKLKDNKERKLTMGSKVRNTCFSVVSGDPIFSDTTVFEIPVYYLNTIKKSWKDFQWIPPTNTNLPDSIKKDTKKNNK